MTHIVVPVVAFAMSSMNFAASISPRWSLYASAKAYKYSAGLYCKHDLNTLIGVFLNGTVASKSVAAALSPMFPFFSIVADLVSQEARLLS